MQIEDALARFLLQLEADGRSQHTIRQYARHVRTLARWARDVGHTGDVSATSHEDVARFLASPQARTSARGGSKRASTGNCLRTSLRGFFRYLRGAGHLSEDPTRLVRRALCGPPPPRALSPEEERRLLETLAGAEGEEARRDEVLFRLMLSTGLRLGSAVSLDLEDVDLERGELRLRTAKGGWPGRVFLGAEVQAGLGEYLRGRPAGPLFVGRAGQRLSGRHVRRRLRAWLGRAGIERPASPHSLRHSFATALYRRTGDVLVVKEALGHRSITSTLVYARADEERVKRAMA